MPVRVGSNRGSADAREGGSLCTHFGDEAHELERTQRARDEFVVFAEASRRVTSQRKKVVHA